MRRHLSLLLLALLLVACGDGNQPSSVRWRNIAVPVPDGWYVVEETPTRLSLASHDLGDPEAELEGDVLAMYFTYEPGTAPDDWRRFVEQQDATLETDDRLALAGEVPATRLLFSHTTLGVPTREMVVLIPSRSVVVLAQPVPQPGSDAPEVFLRHVETFLDVLTGASFGAPQLG